MVFKSFINYPDRKVIAVDVDDTLILDMTVNRQLIKWLQLRKKEGYFIYLWSARGRDHALNAMRFSGTDDLFDCIIGKPSVIIDNAGWSWAKFVRVIKNLKQLKETEL